MQKSIGSQTRRLREVFDKTKKEMSIVKYFREKFIGENEKSETKSRHLRTFCECLKHRYADCAVFMKKRDLSE